MPRLLTRLLIASTVMLLPALAFSSSLQDWEFNINGTTYYPAGGASLGSIPGLDSSGFNATTGQGTLTVTFNNGPGTYYVGAYFYVPVGTPDYNEYGVVNGAPVAGQSYQIDYPEYTGSGSPNVGSGTIVDNLANGTLNDSNSVPGTVSNYLANCGAYGGGAANPNCNDLVSLATGFSFTVTAGNEEQVTFDLSTSDPGGFSVEDVHPVDGSNPSLSAIYLSGSATEVPLGTAPPPPPGTPEPATWSLASLATVFVAYVARRRGLKR